jgi:hypothetical protein
MPEQPSNGQTAGWPSRLSRLRAQRRHLWRRFALFLAVVGPGVITSNVDNDAGGITTYSVSGAQYGYALLWSLIPMTIALYVSEEMCARMGVVTGKGLSDLIREEFGFRTTFYLMIVGFLVDLGNVTAEFAGVAASMQIFGVAKYIAVPIAALLVWINWPLKVRLAADRLAAGPLPVPLRTTTCGLVTTLSAIVRLPVRSPLTLGVKVTLIVQLAATLTGPMQAFV